MSLFSSDRCIYEDVLLTGKVFSGEIMLLEADEFPNIRRTHLFFRQ